MLQLYLLGPHTIITLPLPPPQLIKGDEVILTFACGSMMERDEWTESFRILNQLALSCETGQPLSKPITGKVHGSGR